MNPKRVVCAAIMHDTGLIICGPRHFDSIMHRQIEAANIGKWHRALQGFVDQFGNFLTRQEAFVIAKNNGQIIRQCGNPDGDELYSEHLY